MQTEPRKRIAIESATDLLATEPTVSPNARRPTALLGGTLLVVLRALGGGVWIGSFLLAWPTIGTEFRLDAESERWVLGIIGGTVGLGSLVLLALGWGLWRGSNVARMLTQTWAALSITAAAVAHFSTSDVLEVRATLLTLSLDILILLALSSRNARAWTRGRSRAWRRRAAALG